MSQSRPTHRCFAAWLPLLVLAACGGFAPKPALGAPDAASASPSSPAPSSPNPPRSLRTVSILDRDCLERAGVRRPERLAYGPDGVLFVLDGEQRRVVGLDPAGRAVQTVGGYGEDEASLQLPVDLGIDRRGSLLILDRGRDALIAYDRQGHFLTAREFEGAATEEARAPGARLLSDAFGSLWLLAPSSRDLLPLDAHLAPARVARFLTPEDSVRAIRLAAFLPSGDVWIYDDGAGALRRFGSGGMHLSTLPLGESTAGAAASDLVTDGLGDLVLADPAGQRIRVYDSAGSLLAERALGGPAAPWRPAALAIGPGGRLAVADAERDEIQVLQIESGAAR